MSTKRKSSHLNARKWESVFPPNQDVDENRLLFLARMAYFSIAHYLLYRKLIPLGAFSRRRMEDVILYCFDTSKRWGQKMANMLKGIKEAIELKYIETAFIQVNENEDNPTEATEVFTMRFCYDKGGEFAILDTDGQPLISMHYTDEPTFRNDVKHFIQKLNAVIKKLKKLGPKAKPELKLTYYPVTPKDYEPPFFQPCGDGMYVFKRKSTLYQIGHVSTNETAVAFSIQSVYLTKKGAQELEDILFDEEGVEHGQQFDASNVIIDEKDADMDTPTHVPESPLAMQQNSEEEGEKERDPEVEPENEEVEVHRDEGGKTAGSIVGSPPRIIGTPPRIESSPSVEINPDETIEKDEEEMVTPPPKRPLKRKITPRLPGNVRNQRFGKPKMSDGQRGVPISPEDPEDYPDV